MHILVIDDEIITQFNIRERFKHEKWEVKSINRYDEALDQASYGSYDLIVCDYHLGEKDVQKNGISLIKEIRNRGVITPVILLTGKNDLGITSWMAMEHGADDHIQKPYEMRELAARIIALIRRSFNRGLSNKIRKDNIEIDIITRETYINGKRINLGGTSSIILLKLLQCAGEVLTYQNLITYIWGDNSLYSGSISGTLRVHMTNLKKALGEKIANKIETVNGIGYKFN